MEIYTFFIKSNKPPNYVTMTVAGNDRWDAQNKLSIRRGEVIGYRKEGTIDEQCDSDQEK